MNQVSLTDEANNVLSFLASNPVYAHTTMDKENLRSLLLYTDGTTMSQGRLWNIVSKHLGVGVYKVSLELSNPP